MLGHDLFDAVPVWLLLAGTVAFLLGAAELGNRLGRRRNAQLQEGEKSSVSTMMGSTLGLLAFMLAFTFGMSSSRFDTRKQLAQEEAGAILKSYQRAQFLPDPQRTEASKLLRDYAALRIDARNIQHLDELEGIILKSESVQEELWTQALGLADQPSAILNGFIQSLTDLGDLQTKRIRAVAWNRIPTPIVVALYGLAFLGLAAMGFNNGAAQTRARVPVTVLAIAFSAVIVLIIDLERPMQDLFEVPQEPMLDTARRIGALPPGTNDNATP